MRSALVIAGLSLAPWALACSGSIAVRADSTEVSDGAGAEDGASAVDEAGDEGGATDAGSDAAPDVLPPACPIQQTDSLPGGAARSGGYSGTMAALYAIYSSPCAEASDCAPACIAAGGTQASCILGSECLPGETPDGGLGCLPPTYWLDPALALSESGTMVTAAELILVDIPYDDPLIVTGFGAAIPDGATITGIQFQIRESTLARNAVDGTVQILRDGVPVGTNHAQSAAWPAMPAYVRYGGAYDLWGTSWTTADIGSSGFGVAITPKYTGFSAGNERAYVDSVRLTVFYTTPCD